MALLKIGQLTFLAVAALVKTSAAHGHVTGIVAGGVYHSGYSPSFQFRKDPPSVAGWSDPENLSNGFVSDYSSPDIICHVGATPGQEYVQIAAGGTLDLQWTKWPESHHGPVIDYLANCNGECTDVDKKKLLFNKIGEKGLIDGSVSPGHWASDEMIANNNTWTVTIPSSIAPGKYVLRHETIALHSAGKVGGAQNYPQCINLEITGSGSNDLSEGVLGTKLYTAQDPGILFNIYRKMDSYEIPGPKLLGAGDDDNSTTPTTSSTVVPTTFQTKTTTRSSVRVSSTKPAFLNSTTTTSTIKPTDATDVSTKVSDISSTTTTSTVKTTSATDVSTKVSDISSTTTTSTIKPTRPTDVSTEVSVISSTTTAPTIKPTDIPSVSFTAKVPNRTGKPWRFVCYEVEDE